MTKEDFLAGKVFQRKNNDPHIDLNFEKQFQFTDEKWLQAKYLDELVWKTHCLVDIILDDYFIVSYYICWYPVHAKIYFIECILVEQEAKP